MWVFNLVIAGFAEFFFVLTPTPLVSVMEDRHIAQRHHRYDVICNLVCHHVQSFMMTQCETIHYALKLYT